MLTTLNFFFLFGLLACLVFAIPTTEHQVQKGSFTVERVQNPHYVGNQNRNVPRELYKALVKHGRRPLPGLLDLIDLKTRAVEAEPYGTTGSVKRESKVTAIVENNPTDSDEMYLSPVTIGGQKFLLNLDTGSADLWVRNTRLGTSLLPKGTVLFNESKSSTFQMMKNAKFKIRYEGDSEAAGIVGKDTVDIGGATVTRQAIQLPTTLSDDFLGDIQSSGVVGLAFNSINTVKPHPQATFFDNIAPHLKHPVFTANLRHNAPGSYEFGTINETYAGKLQYARVYKISGRWKFFSRKCVIDGTAYVNDMIAAVADTGTSQLLVTRNIADAYYKKVQGSTTQKDTGIRSFPCDSKLPDIEFSVGDSLATVSGKTLNYGPISEGSEQCFGGLQVIEASANPFEDFMVFGDIFFKNNFVVFDYGNQRIGFAPHA